MIYRSKNCHAILANIFKMATDTQYALELQRKHFEREQFDFYYQGDHNDN